MILYTFTILQNKVKKDRTEKVIRYVSVFGHLSTRPEIMYSHTFVDSILYPKEEVELVIRILEKNGIFAEVVELKNHSHKSAKVNAELQAKNKMFDAELQAKNKMLTEKIKIAKKNVAIKTKPS